MRNPATRFGVASALLFASAAFAQDYPAKPIVVIVPFAAGGPTDTLARNLGQVMSATLKQQIVIDNSGGAGGTIGINKVAKAKPDGYTLLLMHIGMSTAPAASGSSSWGASSGSSRSPSTRGRPATSRCAAPRSRRGSATRPWKWGRRRSSPSTWRPATARPRWRAGRRSTGCAASSSPSWARRSSRSGSSTSRAASRSVPASRSWARSSTGRRAGCRPAERPAARVAAARRRGGARRTARLARCAPPGPRPRSSP